MRNNGRGRRPSIRGNGSRSRRPSTRNIRSGRNIQLFINEYVTQHSDAPAGFTYGQDWFEVYNPNEFDVNLNGWAFANEDVIDGEDVVTIQENIIIPAYGYFIVVADDCDDGTVWGTEQCPEDTYELGSVRNLYPGIPVDYIRIEWKLGGGCDDDGNNCNGERITIYNDSGEIVDRVSYYSDGEGHICGPDESYARVSDGSAVWECRFPNNITLGTSNSEAPDEIDEIVYINEFSSRDRMFPGLNDSSDWVELYNPNNYALNLEGWKISDVNSGNASPIPAGIFIPPRGFLLAMFNKCKDGVDEFGDDIPVTCTIGQCDTGVGSSCWDGQYLHVPEKLGGTDEIRIFNSSGILIDMIAWEGHLISSDNCSWGRVTDGGLWGTMETCDSDSTPGQSNNLAGMIGDVNMDGQINVIDALWVVNHILDVQHLSEAQQLLADVDNNGLINVADIVMIIQMIFGVTPQQQSQIMNEIKKLLKPTNRGRGTKKNRRGIKASGNKNKLINRIIKKQ